MAYQFSNKNSGKYPAQPIRLKRPDGTRLVVRLFTKTVRRQPLVSFDEEHWTTTKEEALQQATHLYEDTWGNYINKA